MYTLEDIRQADPQIADIICEEYERQSSHIELIASENWVSPAVMSAMGSILTNKYAEGYPGKRYYGGCECVDKAEDLARERARELFRMRVRQRAAPFRRSGQHGGSVRGAGARRHGYGYEPGSRRTSDPWKPRKLFRKIFSHCALRGKR